MPRNPKKIHPVRKIRNAASLTQAQLASLVGVSKDYIQSIEIGRAPMLPAIALKIARQTGCALSTETKKDGSHRYAVTSYAVSYDDAHPFIPYTKETFTAHQEAMRTFDPGEFEFITDAAVSCVDLLLRMAKRRGMGTVAAIKQDFEVFVAESYRKYGLEPFFRAEIRENWLTYNRDIPVDQDVANFPLIPLKVAAKYQRAAPDKAAKPKDIGAEPSVKESQSPKKVAKPRSKK